MSQPTLSLSRVGACTLLVLASACASSQQEQQANNANEQENVVENYQGNSEGNNYGNGNEVADNFEGNNSQPAAANTAAKNPVADIDDSELINSTPLDLGATPANPAAGNLPAANMLTTNQAASAPVNPAPANVAPVANAASVAEVPSAAFQSAQPTPDLKIAEVDEKPGTLYWVGYDFQRKDKNLRVQLLTKGRPQYDVFHEINRAKQHEIRVRFYNSDMRGKMRRSLDATEFRSPVTFIRTTQDLAQRTVDVVLTLREPQKPVLFSKRGNVQLTFSVANKYFASKGRVNRPEYTAESLNAEVPSSILPDYAEGSDLPKTTQLSKVYVPDPVGDKFSGQSDALPTTDGEKARESIPGPTDAKGLPVSDYVTPTNGTQLPDSLIPPQGLWNRSGTFMVLAVAQDNFSLSGDAQNSANEFANPQTSNESLDLGTNAPSDASLPDAPESTQILSETSLPTENSEVQGQSLDASTASYSGKPVVLEFQNAPLGEVLKAFSDQIGANFIVAPEISQIPVTIKLRNVPWDAALDAILETNSLAMAKVSENVIRIDRVEAMSRYLLLKDQAQQAKILSEPRKVAVVRLSNARADGDFATRLENFFRMEGVNNRTRLSVDTRTNTVFIEAPPYILSRAKALIEKLDVPEPQVEVVSRLIEVSRQARNFMGIAWNGGLNFDAGRGLSAGSMNFPNNVNSNFSVDPGVNTVSSAGAANFNIGSINDALDLGIRLRMEESKGTAEILQSNRVIVADRSTASISAGQTAYFRVAQNPTFVQPTQQQGGGGTGTTPTQSGLSQANFNLSLNVTPQVTNDGHIRMDLAITSETPQQQALPGADVSTTTRRLNTILKKKSGETAVIGGIYDTRRSEQEVGIPFLSRLPIIGALFRSKTTSEDQTELMMMITPSIVGKDGEALPEDSYATPTGANYGSNQNNSSNNVGNSQENSGNSNNTEAL